MPDTTKPPLVAPGGSWESLKRIIRAYHAAAEQESPTVEQVARLAGLQRPVVSNSNNFLRSAGILQENANKLTPVATRFATGLGLNNQTLASSALQEIIRTQAGLSHLLNVLKARLSMSLEAFRGEIVMVTGLDENSRNLQFMKAVIDMLQESMLVRIENDEITYMGVHIVSLSGQHDAPKPMREDLVKPSAARMMTERTIPIPLGLGRLVHVELPEDWSSRDLPKLLKMLELSLSESEVPAGDIK
jgi:hypothetical protein